jgi:hypothetical protein
LAEFLKTRKHRCVAHPWQAAIEEHLRGGKDNADVDVVLDLPLGEVSYADWTHPAIAEQAANLTLGEGNAWNNCVNGAQAAILAESRNVDDVVKKVFHCECRPKLVQRLHDKIGVAQPAITIIPGATAVRRFRNRGRQRGDNSSRLFEAAEF